MLSIKNLSYSYKKDNLILKNISLNIGKGEVVVITGPSGCGKSTITRIINGLIPGFYGGEMKGEITLNGNSIQNLDTWERGKLIGNVFQDPRSQFFSNEVAGEIAFGCENYGYSHEEICKSVSQSVDDMKIQDIIHLNLHHLSYGMRQKVAIASAKAIMPEIYVMDEPSANLDTQSTYQLGETIKELKEKGKTIIISEHRLYYLRDIADRFVYMKNGEIEKIYSRSEMCDLGDSIVEKYGLRHTDITKVPFVPSHGPDKSQPILEAKNISKQFEKHNVLKDVSFRCNSGEIIGIIGENSSGKSTIGRILSGILKETEGQVLLNNKTVSSKKRLSNIWYISQDLDCQLFGEDLMDELLTGEKVSRELEQKAEDILKSLNLWDYVTQHPSTLSGGQKQRLVFAVALFKGAKVIILDEPTSGLDGKNMRSVSNVMKEIAKLGYTILLITHDVECALLCCNRILYIADGKIQQDFGLTSKNQLLELMGYKV